MIRVEVNYNPRLGKGEQQLLLLPNRLQNLRLVMKQGIVPAFNKMLQRHWDSKGVAFGHKWAQWAPSTLAKRTRKGNASKGLLRDTDHLYKVLFRARTGDDRLKVVGGTLRFQANTREFKAAYHQFGTEHMPIRQVIPDPLPPAFRTTVRDIVREFILSGRIKSA